MLPAMGGRYLLHFATLSALTSLLKPPPAVQSQAPRRIELTFIDGERFVLTMNGADELMVSFDKPSQPEDV